MSVHLHEIQYDDLKRKLPELEPLGDPVAFSIGDIGAALRINTIPALVKLPYPVCWFEGCYEGNAGTIHGVIAFNAPEQLVFLHLARDAAKPGNKWVCYGSSWYRGGALHKINPSEETLLALEEADLEDNSLARLFVYSGHAVCAFLSALHCNNVKKVEHHPPQKLQKARIKRRKVPLFSYWTLELDLGGASEKEPHLGGTHASPRVHLRRGHPRQYAPGLWTWVQPHAVGKKALGMVHKDYAVKPAEKWGQQ